MVSIVITCHGAAAELPIILGSVATQREYKPIPHSRTGAPCLYGAGGVCDYPREVIVVSDGCLYPGPGLDAAYGMSCKILEYQKEGGVGHHTREPGILAAKGDWIVLTNMDNYFMSGWLHHVSQCFMPQVGLVYWDCVHNAWRWQSRPSKLERGGIDLSCVTVRADIAKQVGFSFRDYDGDWDYIDACAKAAQQAGLELLHVPLTLCVHN